MTSCDPEYVYRNACRRLRTAPCSGVTAHLHSKHLHLHHIGLGCEQAKALALAMVVGEKAKAA